MVTINPNPNMNLADAERIVIDFLKQPNDFGDELTPEELQDVVDAVLSIKKLHSGNPNYDRISAVNILRHRDKDEVQLGGDECARAKNDKMYLTEDHMYKGPYRFSLVSLLFHESEHNMQYFNEVDNPCSDFSRKPELASPANVGAFKQAVLSMVRASNNSVDLKAILHVFESDYYGQKREIEAYGAQADYMNSVLGKLTPIMRNGDYDTRATLETYERMHAKYLPTGHLGRAKKDPVLWDRGREIIDGYVSQKLGVLADTKTPKTQGEIISALSGVIAGLHYSYNEETAKTILNYVYGMPEDSFDNMSNKAMAINSLITATKTPVDMEMMSTLGGLFARLADHPENGQVVGTERNMSYSREKFYSDYAFYDRAVLDNAYGAGPRMVKSLR